MSEVFLLYKAVQRTAEERAAGVSPSVLVGVFSEEHLARNAQLDLGGGLSWVEPWPCDELAAAQA